MNDSLLHGTLLALAGYLLLVLLLLRALRRKRRKIASTQSQETAKHNHHYHTGRPPNWLDCLTVSGVYWGVRLQAQEGADYCSNIQPLLGQSFPLKNAPNLPLQQCGLSRCRCYFQPLVEQRSNRPRRLNSERRFMLRYEPQRGSRRRIHDRRRVSHAFREVSLRTRQPANVN